MKKILWLIIILILVFALVQIPSSDDFCNKLQINKMGTWSYLNHLYFHWTGRLITSFVAIIFLDQLTVVNFNIISFFNAACFLGALFLLSKMLILSKKEILLASFILIFFIGARSQIAQFIFWPTGGIVYSFSYLVFFATLIVIRREKSPFALVILSIFVCSFLIETINPALLVFMYPLLKDEKNNSKRLALLVAFGLASCLLYFAPGNFARASSSGGLNITISKLVANYFYLLYKSLRYLWGAALLAVLAGYFAHAEGILLKERILKDRWLFLIAGLSSISPFMLVPNQFNGRSSSFFIILVTTFVFVCSVKYFKEHCILSSKKHLRIAMIIPVFFMLLMISDIFKMSDVRSSFLQRDDYLKTQTNKMLVISPLSGQLPVSSHFDDVREDQGHWINRCVASHYSLKGIALDKKNLKLLE